MKALEPVTVVLTKPIDYCDEHYDSFTLDFSGLTGKDDMAIRKRIEKQYGRMPVSLEGSAEYAANVAAAAAGIDIDVLDVVSAADMMAIMDEVNSYLDSCELHDGTLFGVSGEIRYDFESLTGKDVLSAERACGVSREDKRNDVPFLSALAAKACGMTPAAIRELPLCDHAGLILVARTFLYVSALRNQQQKTLRKLREKTGTS